MEVFRTDLQIDITNKKFILRVKYILVSRYLIYDMFM